MNPTTTGPPHSITTVNHPSRRDGKNQSTIPSSSSTTGTTTTPTTPTIVAASTTTTTSSRTTPTNHHKIPSTTTTPRSFSSKTVGSNTATTTTTPQNSLWARSHQSRGLTIETTTPSVAVAGVVVSRSSGGGTATTSTTTPTITRPSSSSSKKSITERLYHSPTKSSISKQSPPKGSVVSPHSISSTTTTTTTPKWVTSTTTTPRSHGGIGGGHSSAGHHDRPPSTKILSSRPEQFRSTTTTTTSTRTTTPTSSSQQQQQRRPNGSTTRTNMADTPTSRGPNQSIGKKHRSLLKTPTTTTTTPHCGCGIDCQCHTRNHCDCYEELCQCHAYRIIQSLQPQVTPCGARMVTNPTPDDRWKMELLVRGMTCTMCSQAVDTAIRKVFSTHTATTTTMTLQHIDISFVSDTVTVEWIRRHNPTTTASSSNHTTTNHDLDAESVIDFIRNAITAIGYDVDDLQMIHSPLSTTTSTNGEPVEDEENPPSSPPPILSNITTPNSNRHNVSVEDRWQRYRQRQVDKVEQRRCAFMVAMILTLPILTMTMILPYAVPHLYHQYQKRLIAIPFIHRVVSLPLEGLILWIFATPVQFICGYEFYKMAWYGFWSGTAGMDLLVAMGTTASYLYALHGVVGTTPAAHEDDPSRPHTDTTHFFETSTILIVFVLAGKWMQAAAVRRTSDAITQLMSLQCPTAIRITPQQQQGNDVTTSGFNPLSDPYIEEIVNVEDIVVGDMVKVIRGASIPVDGCVLFGDIAVDESMMTGESLPIVKMKGSMVLGGTVCVESSSDRQRNALSPSSGSSLNPSPGSVGAAFIQVTGVGSSSALAKIVDLVQQAQSRAVPIQSFADQVSAIFVPTVCAISLITYLVWYALCSSNVVPVEWYRDELGEDSVTFSMMFAIACLVISCPCALGLATPTAIMVGTGVGAKCGILMKGGSALEVASKVNTVIFDKTGTLTKGVPSVSDMIHLPGNQKTDVATEDYILWVLGSLERTSEHPLAKAIVKYAEERLGDVLETNPFIHPTDFQTITGRGASGVVGGNMEVAVGNRSFAAIMGIAISEETDSCMQRLEEVGKTAIIVALNGKVCLVLGIGDQVKDDAAASIAYLRDTMGIDVWMVTGDNSRTAAAISQQVGLPSDRVLAEALPATKLEKVRSLQADGRNVVCMVGDGINDSAALAQADVGIGMGTGADIATEASDMILVKGHVADVCTALHLSRALFRRIQWNLTLSLIYNLLGIPVAVGVFYPIVHLRLPPTIAAVAMALSSISVVLSSLTLRFYRPPNVSVRRRVASSRRYRGGNTMTANGDVDGLRLALISNDHLVDHSNN